MTAKKTPTPPTIGGVEVHPERFYEVQLTASVEFKGKVLGRARVQKIRGEVLLDEAFADKVAWAKETEE
jgi:hypothetical protein